MTAALVEETTTVISEPGVYLNVPEDAYHRDPVAEGSLSCSGAKRLLSPGCPALFRYEQENGRPDKRQFDIGHAAHKLVLGVGAEIVVIPGDRWDTNAAKAAVKAAREAGQIPVKQAEHDAVQAMAAKLREHPLAGALLKDGRGSPEASLFWRDELTGVMRRARLDFLPHRTRGRLIVVDYKTSTTANPDAFGRAAADYGYDMQDATYTEGVAALDLDDEPAFVFIVQDKNPPYLVSVVQLDSLAKRIGRHRNRKAVDLYFQCRMTDEWPDFGDDVTPVSLPRWAELEYESETST